jgi:hypothetical protein
MTTCRWCSQFGHNIRSCQVRKKWCADVLSSPTSTPRDRAAAQNYIERYDATESRLRRCKFCKGSGHDLRTCSDFQEIIDTKSDSIWKARRALRDRLVEESFGPGSLVSCEVTASRGFSSRKRQTLAAVIEIRWNLLTDMDFADSINWHHQRPMIVRPIDEHRDYYMRLPRSIIEVPFSQTSGRWRTEKDYKALLSVVEIVSPSSSPNIPSSFLNASEIGKVARNWAKDYYF